MVSELIRADVPYRTRDLEGRTPLHHAAAGGHIPVLKVLVAEMQKGRPGSTAGPGGATGVGGGGGGISGRDDQDDEMGVGRHHTLMMDGGPFK